MKHNEIEETERRHLLQKLEETRVQLLRSEKLASIGQLSAGIAHEINNPVAFVYSNLRSLQDDVGDLLTLLDAYDEFAQRYSSEPEATERIREIKEQMDYSFVREDTPNLIRESIEGTRRIQTIVRDLREFSHMGAAKWVAADLHAELEKTLNVIHHELKNRVEVIQDYGEIRPVECLPSEINQVFMNLLMNAGQAIAEEGTITICTRCQGDGVAIGFTDSGSGIPTDTAARIFEPFFTTKPAGKGTGLGLSISHEIIQRHGGRIDVESELGVGTTFTVWLPAQQSPRPDPEA